MTSPSDIDEETLTYLGRVFPSDTADEDYSAEEFLERKHNVYHPEHWDDWCAQDEADRHYLGEDRE